MALLLEQHVKSPLKKTTDNLVLCVPVRSPRDCEQKKRKFILRHVPSWNALVTMRSYSSMYFRTQTVTEVMFGRKDLSKLLDWYETLTRKPQQASLETLRYFVLWTKLTGMRMVPARHLG